MSFRYAIIGAGRTGRAAAYDLANHGQAQEIRLFDLEPAQIKASLAMLQSLVDTDHVKISGSVLDARDSSAVKRAIQGVDAVLSCSAYWLNADLAAAALEQGAHFNDLGGNTEVVKRELMLNSRATQRGLSIIPDCGLAPGLVNTLGAAGLDDLATCERVALRCGGLPQKPQGPLDYALSFSISGLTNEYTGEALVLRAGQVQKISALSELEDIDFADMPPLEAFVTTGGTSTAPENFAGRLSDYDYKTIRYRGHRDKLKLLDALGLFSLTPIDVNGQQVVPRRLFEAAAAPHLNFGDPNDMILLRATCDGLDAQGQAQRLIYELVDRYDAQTGLSAMERCTAFPAACVTWMQASGKIAPGAQALELALPARPFIEALAPRGLHIRRQLDRR